MAKKALIVDRDAVETLEIFYPYFRPREELEADAATPTKKLNRAVFVNNRDSVDKVVVVDGNLGTAKSRPDNPAWMRGFIK